MDKQKYYDLKAKRATALEELKGLTGKEHQAAYDVKIADLKAMNGELDKYEELIAESGRFENTDTKMVSILEKKSYDLANLKAQRDLDGIRTGNEYVKAFATALKTGATPKTARGEAFAPLFAAKTLTIGGGDPVGSDGGFLVPVDFDNQIHEIAKDYFDFSTLFHCESVTAPAGWRAVAKSGAPKALPVIGEGVGIGTVDQPEFVKVDYSVKKYGDRLPISRELLDDNTAGLLAYLARWFAPKYIATKNALLMDLLTDVDVVALTTGREFLDLRSATIKKLNTAAARRATYVTNQGGYAVLNNWVDNNGRPLLVPNPADLDCYRFGGRPVLYADSDLIPDGGTDSAVTYPLFVGDFSQVGTLFERKGLEIATTDVGGNAWTQDTPELRVLCRLDAQLVNKAAAYAANLADPVEEDDSTDGADNTNNT